MCVFPSRCPSGFSKYFVGVIHFRFFQRVFVVNFGAPQPGTEALELKLLSETIAFLVANGNTTTDEVGLSEVFVARRESFRLLPNQLELGVGANVEFNRRV